MRRTLTFWALLSCGAMPEAVGVQRDPVIYGSDDRLEYFEETDTRVAGLLRDSTVIAIDPTMVDASNPNNVQLQGPTVMSYYSTCASERYGAEPTPGFCSGTLIDDDLVLTAGHCITSQSDCDATSFVFHFYEASAGHLATITADDVYTCKKIIVRANRSSAPFYDYGVIQIDRAATPSHVPAEVSTGFVTANQPLILVGYPLGMPGKTDRGHVISANVSSADYFDATIDAYEGNSGSGVFDTMYRVVGLESAGSNDFTKSGSCYVSDMLPDNGSGGDESVSYAFTAIDALCKSTTPSARLCGSDGGVATPDGGQGGGAGGGAGTGGGSADTGGGSANTGGGSASTGGGSSGTGGGTDMMGASHCGCSTDSGLLSLAALSVLARAFGRRAR